MIRHPERSLARLHAPNSAQDDDFVFGLEKQFVAEPTSGFERQPLKIEVIRDLCPATSVLRMMHSLADILALAGKHDHLMHLFLRYGLVGLFLVSIVDSSFVPLPIPGVTDIMLVLFAAQHANPVFLIAIATAGSALGGWFSWRVGQSGGMAFIEKRTPPRIFKRVCGWMESHALLSVALPAILPPPMPLSPFVLAAGALKMPLKRFLISFTASRLVRHTIAVLLGIRYGKHVLHFWFKLSEKYGTPVLIVLWSFILVSVAYAFYQLWKTSHTIAAKAETAATA